MAYIVEGDALHGFVLLQGVHLVQVAVGDEHSPVLRLVETVDLENAKPSISQAFQRWRRVSSGGQSLHLSHVAGKQDSHEFVFPLQLARNQCE